MGSSRANRLSIMVEELSQQGHSTLKTLAQQLQVDGYQPTVHDEFTNLDANDLYEKIYNKVCYLIGPDAKKYINDFEHLHKDLLIPKIKHLFSALREGNVDTVLSLHPTVPGVSHSPRTNNEIVDDIFSLKDGDPIPNDVMDFLVNDKYSEHKEFLKYPEVSPSIKKLITDFAISRIKSPIHLINVLKDGLLFPKSLQERIDKVVEIMLQLSTYSQYSYEDRCIEIANAANFPIFQYVEALLRHDIRTTYNSLQHKSVIICEAAAGLTPEQIKHLLKTFILINEEGIRLFLSDLDFFAFLSELPIQLDDLIPIEKVKEFSNISQFLNDESSKIFSSNYKKNLSIEVLKQRIVAMAPTIEDDNVRGPANYDDALLSAIEHGVDGKTLKSVCGNIKVPLRHNLQYFIEEDVDALNALVQKSKDFMFIGIWNNYMPGAVYIINIYQSAKNKSLTDLYHEAWKQNPKSLITVSKIAESETYKREASRIQGLVKKCAEHAVHAADYFKLFERLGEIAELIHDNHDISSTMANCLLFNRSVDLSADWVENFIETLVFLDPAHETSQGLSLYNTKLNASGFLSHDILGMLTELESINPTLINNKEFLENLKHFDQINQQISAGTYRITKSDLDLLKSIATTINKIQNIKTLKEYVRQAQPKQQDLFKLDLNVDGCNFKVLSYLDPYAFDVGLDTDCCQRIGGAGESAAIDSFINPFAGVLLCQYGGMLLAQSYFHYVPKDNGFILDNVEYNENNCKRMGWKINQNDTCVELTKVFADFAQQLKALNSDIKYVRCGVNYNKIQSNMFEKSTLPDDPRDFDVDEPYSDFDENNHIDLLKPSDSLKTVRVMMPKAASIPTDRFHYRPAMIKIAFEKVLDADQILIDAAIRQIKGSDVIKKLFKEKDVDLNLIDLIPIVFSDIDTSARTDKGIIYLNSDLISTPEDIEHYLVHEITHFLQQCFSDGPTVGSTDDSYLDNKFEQEGFSRQVDYITDTEGPEASEQYIDKVIEHHEVPEDEVEEKKDKLMGKDAVQAQSSSDHQLDKVAGLVKVPLDTLAELSKWAKAQFAYRVLENIEKIRDTQTSRSIEFNAIKKIVENQEFNIASSPQMIVDFAKQHHLFSLRFSFSTDLKEGDFISSADPFALHKSINVIEVFYNESSHTFALQILTQSNKYLHNGEQNLTEQQTIQKLTDASSRIADACRSFVEFAGNYELYNPKALVSTGLVERTCRELIEGIPNDNFHTTIHSTQYFKDIDLDITGIFITDPAEKKSLHDSDEWIGLWMPRNFTVYIGSTDDRINKSSLSLNVFNKATADLHETCRHELQHTVQTIFLLINNAKGGYPSKNISNKEEDDHIPLDTNMEHSKRDIEFYTDLTDAIQTFKTNIVKYPPSLRMSMLLYCIDSTNYPFIDDDQISAAFPGFNLNEVQSFKQTFSNNPSIPFRHIKYVFRSFKGYDEELKTKLKNKDLSMLPERQRKRLEGAVEKRVEQYGKYEKAVKEFYKEVDGLLEKQASKNPNQMSLTFPKEPPPEPTKEVREQFIKDLEEGNLQPKFKKHLQHKLPEFERRYRKRMLEQLLRSIKEPPTIKSAGIPQPDQHLFDQINRWLEDEFIARVQANVMDITGPSIQNIKAVEEKVRSIPDEWDGQNMNIMGHDMPVSLDDDFIIEKLWNGKYRVHHGDDEQTLPRVKVKAWYKNKILAYRKNLKWFLANVGKSIDDNLPLYNFLVEIKTNYVPTGTFSLTDKIFQHPDQHRRIRVSLWFDTHFNSERDAGTMHCTRLDDCWLNLRFKTKGIYNTTKLNEVIDRAQYALGHELIHFDQMTTGKSFPSKHIMTNKEEDKSAHQKGEGGGETRQYNQFDAPTNTSSEDYLLDDYEFYPQILTAVGTFKRLTIGMGAKETSTFLRYWIGMTNLYDGKEKPSEFFIKLRDEAPDKYKKAVKEFFKAVAI